MGPLEALSLLFFQVMSRKQWPSFGPELSWALPVRLLPESQPCSCRARLALSSVPGNISGEQTSVQLYRRPQSASVGSMMTTLNLEVR